MNRLAKNKLALRGETIRALTRRDLGRVVGGALTSICDSGTHVVGDSYMPCGTSAADSGDAVCSR